MKLSLTQLVDVVSKSGARKASQVATIKACSLENYHPAKDFYKQLRDAVVALHKSDKPKHLLDATLFTVTEKNRRVRYGKLIPAYKKWLGKKSISWFQPASNTYQYADVTVAINPELGLEINGVRHVIKLYFKAAPLEKQSAALVVALMETMLPAEDESQFAVLDVERGKLFLKGETDPEKVLAMINAELAYVADLWSSLDQAA